MIFIVDDRHLIAETLRVILQAAGHSAMAFENADDALAAAKSEHPTYLLTDVQMEGMDGFELAERMRCVVPNCFIAIMSGHLESGEIRRQSREAQEVFEKPFHPGALLRSISKTLAPKIRWAPRPDAFAHPESLIA